MPEELKILESGMTSKEIAKKLQRSVSSVESKLYRDKELIPVPVSTMPKFDRPLKSEGDAVVMSDIEAPFHNAEFINRVLDLADSWGIKTLHLNGDLLHYDSLSKWGAEWIEDDTEANFETIKELIEMIPAKIKDAAIEKLEKIGMLGKGGGLSDEMTEARQVFRSFGMFDNIFVGLGNTT